MHVFTSKRKDLKLFLSICPLFSCFHTENTPYPEEKTFAFAGFWLQTRWAVSTWISHFWLNKCVGSSPHNSVKATDVKRPVAKIPAISTAVTDPNTSHSVTRPFAMIHCVGLRDSKIFPCPLVSSFDSHCPPWIWTCHLTCSQLRGAYLRGQLQDCIQDFCIATVCGLTIQSTRAKM